MTDQVGKNGNMRGTNQFSRRGHTAGAFGNNPSIQAKGAAKQTTQELKP